jgi:hypothetical protein
MRHFLGGKFTSNLTREPDLFQEATSSRPFSCNKAYDRKKVDSQEPFLSVPIEQVNYLAGHKSMAMTKRYDHANEERYGAAIEALDAAGKTGSAEALAAARWKQTD